MINTAWKIMFFWFWGKSISYSFFLVFDCIYALFHAHQAIEYFLCFDIRTLTYEVSGGCWIECRTELPSRLCISIFTFPSVQGTDKRTDACSRHFMIWKINSGLVGSVGPFLWKKSLGQIISNFWGLFFMFSRAKFFFENIILSTLKSCIETR